MGKENAGTFELSPEAQAALGVNSDYSFKDEPDSGKAEENGAEQTKTDESTGAGAEKKDESKAEPEKGQPAGENPEEKEKGEKTGEKEKGVEEGEPEENENLDEGEDDLEGEPDFRDLIIERIDKSFDSVEKKEQLLKDLENYEKFMASNTQKSQEIAELRRQAESVLKKFDNDRLAKSLELLQQDEQDYEDFLKSTDEWFQEKESNPIRELIESVQANTEEVEKIKKESKEELEREAELKLREELIDLYALDHSYKDDMDKLDKLAELADKEGINLIQAHKLQQAEQFTEEIASLKDQLKESTAKIKSLEKELKSKSEQSKKENEIKSPDIGLQGQIGASNFRYNPEKGTVSSFDETERRLREKFGLE